MTISKRFLSSIFVSQVIVTILVISSISLSAMDWDGEFRPHAQMVVAGEQDGQEADQQEAQGPEGEQAAPAQAQENKVEGKEEQAERNIPAGLYYQRLKSLLEDGLRTAKIAREIAELAGMADAIAGVALYERQMTNQLRGLSNANVNGLLTKEEAQGAEQSVKQCEDQSDLLFSAAVKQATRLGRPDLVARLEGKQPTISERLSRFSPDGLFVGMGVAVIASAVLMAGFKTV